MSLWNFIKNLLKKNLQQNNNDDNFITEKNDSLKINIVFNNEKESTIETNIKEFDYKEFLQILSLELDECDIIKINKILKEKYPNIEENKYLCPFINEAHFIESIIQWELSDFDFVFKMIKQIMYHSELLYIQRSLEFFINQYKKTEYSNDKYWEQIALEELKILPYFIVEAKANEYKTNTNGIKYLCQKYNKEKRFDKVAELSRIAILLNLDDGTNTGYLGRLERAQKNCGNNTFDFEIGYTSKTLPKLLNNIKKNNKNEIQITKLNEYVDDYIVIDIETTGLNPEYCEIIELSAIEYINNKQVEVFNVFVKPNEIIPEYITKINGITNKMVENANPINVELPRFIDFIQDSILIGHNIRFDIGFIVKYCNQMNINYSKFDVIDTLTLARKNLSLNNYKLETIGQYLGYNIEYHRALNDCLVTNSIYQYIKNK